MRITASWFGPSGPPNTRMWHEHSCTTRELPLDFVTTITSVPSCSEPSRPSLTVAAKRGQPLTAPTRAATPGLWVGAKKLFQVEQRN